MAIYLHIGFPKTATTSLQLALQAHQAELADAGVCYPLIDSDFKQRYLKVFDQKGQQNDAARAGLKVSVDRMADQIRNSGCPHTVLSCEELTNFMMMAFSPNNLHRLRACLTEIDPDIRLIAYVRNPADYYLSILQERLKRHGGTLKPDDFQTRFATIILLYEEVFDAPAHVREFHPTRLLNGDIVEDFFDAVGITGLETKSWDRITSNESISPEVLLALDLSRRELDPEAKRTTYQFAESELLWRRLRRQASDAGLARKPVLYKSAHDAVVAANLDDARRLQERYGIDFAPGKYVDQEPDLPEADRVSGIESIMSVDREQSTYIWSAVTLQLVKEVLRSRKKLQQVAEQSGK